MSHTSQFEKVFSLHCGERGKMLLGDCGVGLVGWFFNLIEFLVG